MPDAGPVNRSWPEAAPPLILRGYHVVHAVAWPRAPRLGSRAVLLQVGSYRTCTRECHFLSHMLFWPLRKGGALAGAMGPEVDIV